MKKLFTFLAGAALLGSLSACSSDEPAKGPDGSVEGNTMYLNVRISSAGDIGRADTEGDLKPGDVSEHGVTDAYFFFFDKDGIFINQANVWHAGSDGASEGNNVELTSNNVVVLEKLTEENLPKYMITVLNAPESLLEYIKGGVRTIDQVRNFHEGLGIRETPDVKNGDGIVTEVNTSNFVMSTSSFYHDDQEYKDDDKVLCRHDDKYYYANMLEPTDFHKNLTSAANSDPIDIYVERLAAKFTISGLEADNKFKVRVTVAGEDNTGNTETDHIAATDVWVKINNFGVTCVENESYLSKNLDGFTSESLWNGWYDATKHRSFWGKSVSYGKSADELALYAPIYATVTGSLNGGAVYSPESTNEPSKIRVNAAEASQLQSRSVTNIVFTATTYADEACTTPLDLILYGGVYYKEKQFYKYILSRLNGKGSLNYYRYTGSTPITTPTHEGSVENFIQVSSDEITRIKYGDETGEIELKTTIGDGTDLWAKSTTSEGKTIFTKITNGVSALNTALNSFFTDGHPTSYTSGATVYYVPVEHLLGQNWGSENGPSTRIVTKEGEFGVVRNHWYDIEVTGLMSMGYGVFDPSEGSTETLRPKPTTDTYALGARIKILSWKLVKQSVVL